MISLMFSLTSTEAAVLLPCGQTWRKCVSLYKRGGAYHYDFTVFGRRYRGSTWCLHPKGNLSFVPSELIRVAVCGVVTSRDACFPPIDHRIVYGCSLCGEKKN